jgi:hypothetical protein
VLTIYPDFLPCDIFASVYYRHCYRAFSAHHGAEKGITPVEFCKKLEAQYSKMHAELSATMPARRLHQKNIQSYKIQWQSFKSSRTCLLCLRRAPEHVLRCGHSICDTCTRIFGVKEDGMEYSYRFTRCLLCDTRAFLKIRIKPPTAGSRLLVLDGGGIRGSFTLQALQALERHRRLPYPIYDEFDLSLGTSSGKLTRSCVICY